MKHPAIGTWLAFAAIADTRKAEGSGSRRVELVEYPLTQSIAGQMVGVTYLYSGLYMPGGYEDQGCIKNRKAALVYQVRLGLRSKPVLVLPSTCRRLIKGPPDGLPWTAPALPWAMEDWRRTWRFVGQELVAAPQRKAGNQL